MSDPQPKSSPPDEPQVILLVDDSNEDRTAIRRLLVQELGAHYTIREAAKVADALESFRQIRPDAVLLDHHLPDGNGIELLEALQQEIDEDGGTAFVMLTATAGPEVAVEALRRGAHDYLNKGRLRANELNKALTNALEKVRLARELEQQRQALKEKNTELESQLEERRKAERALQQSEALSQSIFDAAGDCIEVLDVDGRLRQINRQGLLLLEIEDTGAVTGRDWLQGWGPATQEVAGAALEKARSGGEGRLQGERATLKGSAKWWDVLISPIRDVDSRITSLVAVSRDITEAKRHEAALAEAKATAEAASRAKDDFLAALSHELRTPLNPVLLIASEREADPGLPPEVADDFAAIRKNVELESRLIDDLLDITRIVRGKLRLDIQRASLRTLLHASLDLLSPDIRSKKLVVKIENEAEDVMINVDPVRMQQVFWNVVKNAVKFTPGGGCITVGVRRQDGWVHVTVKDTGTGIPPEDLETIFASFNQGRRGHQFGGLGLGLGISRGLVTLHGGRISATSEGPGTGATFLIEIPLAQTARPTAAQPSAASGDGDAAPPGLHILLVEDHSPTCETLARMLRRRHHQVQTATCLKEAADAAESTRFDLILSDVGLPDGSGYDVMRRLHALQPHCKGIALSGYGMEADVNNSAAAGFDVHLIKPVDVRTLLAAIEKVMA